MDMSHSYGPEAKRMRQAGVRLTRFGAAEAWHTTQLTPGGPPVPYAGLEEVLKENDIHVVATLQGVPRNLLTLPQKVRTGRPQRFIGLEWNDEIRSGWRDYVSGVAKNFTHIAAFESWNESNAASYFLGPASVVAEMITINRETIEASGKEAIILGPTLSMVPQVYIKRVLEKLPSGTIDGISLHPYRTGVGRPEDTGFLHQLDALKEIFTQTNHPDAKIWITEMGWLHTDQKPRPIDRGLTVTRTESTAADLILRSVILGLSRGVEKQVLFRWRDGSDMGAPSYFGKFRPDGLRSPKLSLLAVNTLQHLFPETQYKETLHENDPVFAYRFKRADDDIVSMWSSYGITTVKINGYDPTSHVLLDRFGRKIPHPENGLLNLTEQPNFVILPHGDSIKITPLIRSPSEIILSKNNATDVSFEHRGDITENLTSKATLGDGAQNVSQNITSANENKITVRIEAVSANIPLSRSYLVFRFDDESGSTSYVTIPSLTTGKGTLDAPLDLFKNSPNLSVSSGNKLSTLERDDNDILQISIKPSSEHFSAHWTALMIEPLDKDISGYKHLTFEIQAIETSDDMALSYVLHDTEGYKYMSWHQPDILMQKGNWTTVRIPLKDFNADGLFLPHKPETIPNLGAVRNIQLSFHGNNPLASAVYRIKNLLLE